MANVGGRNVNGVQSAIVLILALLSSGKVFAEPPSGFEFIQEWGVYARGDDIFWHGGVQWKLSDGTWVRLEGGNWIPDSKPPVAIVRIPKDKVHCPPGLAKKGCTPPGHRKKKGYGHRKWK